MFLCVSSVRLMDEHCLTRGLMMPAGFGTIAIHLRYHPSQILGYGPWAKRIGIPKFFLQNSIVLVSATGPPWVEWPDYGCGCVCPSFCLQVQIFPLLVLRCQTTHAGPPDSHFWTIACTTLVLAAVIGLKMVQKHPKGLSATASSPHGNLC